MSPLLKPFVFLYDSFVAFALLLLRRGGTYKEVEVGVEVDDGWSIGQFWSKTRSLVLVPLFKYLVAVFLVLSSMIFIEYVYMNLVVVLVKLFRRKPEKVYKCDAMEEDIEGGRSNFPYVLIQIPMYNEREVFQLSIGAACKQIWPCDRLFIQVLDDSTDAVIKEAVDKECARWASKGINIKCERRDNRSGYKAGAMKQGMNLSYVKHCEYVAIFDADFQPEPDFLIRTIPFLVNNPEIALVQARWQFVNANACLMTRMQEMSLNYHFTTEQESGSSIHAFFGFNGTAGVWRISAMKEAGGWKDRTTVEDMDLAVRAGLHGWKFVFVGDLLVKSELPSQFKAFRFQQHRWSCGPANLFRKTIAEIIHNQKVSLLKKLYVVYSFFFIRKIAVHVFTFVFYCLILPTSVFFPEVEIPRWATIYIPCLISLSSALATPRSFYLLGFWILFENVMALHRTKGTFIGIVEAGRVNEWVVTQKIGDALKTKLLPKVQSKSRNKCFERLHLKELSVGIYMFCCACYNVAFGSTFLYIYLYLQAIAFIICGSDFVGKYVPCF